jgi:hypothetical protein
MKRFLTIQLFMAVLLVLSGIVLMFSGFWVAPEGEIHNSVLVAFGEIGTFAGALFGVDYSYKKFLHVSLKLKGRNRRQIIRI